MIKYPRSAFPWRLAALLACSFWGSIPVLAEDAARFIVESQRFSKQIEVSSTKAQKMAAAENSLDFARSAVAADPTNSEAHVTLAVALGKMTDYVNSRTKMESARLIHQEAEIALRLDPKNDFACLILGKWHDEMSRLNPALKLIATTIFGKLPEASAAQAENYFRQAVFLDPKQMRHHFELAKFLDRDGPKQEALVEWQKVVELPAKDAEDREFIASAKHRLRR